MTSGDAIRRGVANEGGFFSPYYLFDLMVRRHRDELDLDGRERERRMLPRVYRRAMARLGMDATRGELWREWYRELFEALGLETQALDDGIMTPHHGRVPVSHVVVGPGGVIVALLDTHLLDVDLDRDRYDEAVPRFEDLTREPIGRAFELSLDAQQARWGLLTNGAELRLYRRGSPVTRQYLRVDFDALFEADRDDEWTAFWGLFRRDAFVPDSTGTCLLDRVLDESHRHASKIAEDLRENVVEAVEALVQGILDDRENACVWGGGLPDRAALDRLFEESLHFLYRLLFVLYAESRDILPVGESRAYRDTYSVEHLRDLAEKELRPEDAGKTYYIGTLRTLFRLLRKGFSCSEFEVPALGGRGPEDPDWDQVQREGDAHLTSLFDGRRTLWLDQFRIPDGAMRRVIRELSLSRPRRRAERRERYSYADLGVDQLGSVYEGLLAYEPAMPTEETVLVTVKGETRLIAKSEAEEHNLSPIEGSNRRPGTFVLGLWGGRRKNSGSYYTPQEVTAFLVKEALEPRVDPIIARAATVWEAEQGRAVEQAELTNALPLPEPHTQIADEILDIKICDPAMGSGAFLVQACRYLAEAYGRALVAEGREESGRLTQETLIRFKRLVAERCLYGVDLNPLAVELAKVSLWLETLARGRPLSFLDAHLRCGHSLIAAPLREDSGHFTFARIATIPSKALAYVSKDAPEAARTRRRQLTRRNDQMIRRLAEARSGRRTLGLFDLDDRLLASTLEAYTKSRADLEASDQDRPDSEALRLREQKEHRFREAYESADSPVHRLKQICDLWCASWFWPEEEDVEPFDTDAYREAAGQILASLPINAPWANIAIRVAREQRFFHWELEFPEVFLRSKPGFDAMVGNPPWEKVSGDPGELAEEYDALLKTLRGDEREARLREILADPAHGPHIRSRARSRAEHARYCREGPLFADLVRGEVNTFAPFAVLFWRLHREGGAMAVVLKDAFHLTESLGPIRAEMLLHGQIRVLATSDNERKIFDAHHLLRFDLLVAGRGRARQSVPVSVHRFRTGREIIEHLNEAADVPLDLLRDADGKYSEPIPEILDSWWPKLFEKARHAAAGSSRVRWSAELHSSGDKAVWTRDGHPKESPGPVLAMVAAFNAFAYKPLAWLRPDALARAELRKVQWESWRVGVRKRANQKDERVLIAGLIPPHVATCDYLQVTREPTDPLGATCCAALANSLFLDFLLRPFVGSNMQQGILERLPWALLSTDGKVHAIVSEVARLFPARPEYRQLAVTLGLRDVPLCANDTTPLERAVRRARIDARVAQLYRLEATEFARVLAWFPLLDQDQPPLSGEPRSFITRDLALLEYFRVLSERPPRDIVTFFREAEVDLVPMTGSIRDLEERVEAATRLGAVAYVPSARGARGAAQVDPDDDDLAEGFEREGEADDRVPEMRPRRAVRSVPRRAPARRPGRRRRG